MVESFVVLNAVGGERVDDFQHLRDDAGLKEMLGHEVPSPEAARQFLNRFQCSEASCKSNGCESRPWKLSSCHGSHIQRQSRVTARTKAWM